MQSEEVIIDAHHSDADEKPGNWNTILCRLFEKVLSRKPSTVKISDSFLALGGNSLQAVKLMNEISKSFKVSVSVSRIFECNSIRSLVAYLEQEQPHVYIIPKLQPGNMEANCLSFRMELLWEDICCYSNMTSYNISNIFRIQQGFERKKLEWALDQIVERHEILRTVIRALIDGKPYMLITQKNVEIGRVSVKTLIELQHALLDFNDKPFQLTQNIPMRVNFFEVEDSDSYISICFHHIAVDVWSHEIFLKELCELYNNNTVQLPPLEIQYKDYAAFQRTLFTGQLLDKHISFWKVYLCGFKRLKFKPDLTPTSSQYLDLAISAHFALDSDKSNALRDLAIDYDTSLFSLLLGAFYIALAVETGQMDITVSTSVACRDMFQLNELIGLFSNEVPVRQSISPEITLENFVKSVWENVKEVQNYSGLPQSRILTEAGFPTNGLAGENTWIPVSFQADELEITDCQYAVPIQLCIDQFPMLCEKAFNRELSVFMNVKDSFEGLLAFAADLYRQETAQRFTDTFKKILNKMAEIGDSEALVRQFMNLESVGEEH